ncbi:MAG: toxin-activating lysine-acyltransferase [Duganella sp.]
MKWHAPMHSLRYILDKVSFPADAAAERSVLLGLVMGEALRLGHCRALPIASLWDTWEQAAELDQIALFFDHTGRAVGYVSWMTLSAPHIASMLTGQNTRFSLADRCSGPHLWITELVVAHGCLTLALAHMRDTLFPTFDQVTYFRTKGSKRIAKRISTRRGHALFTAAPAAS